MDAEVTIRDEYEYEGKVDDLLEIHRIYRSSSVC